MKKIKMWNEIEGLVGEISSGILQYTVCIGEYTYVYMKSQLIGKDPDAGKGWGKEEKGATKDERVGWHDRFHGQEFEQTLEIVKDREDRRAAVHEVTKSGTWLTDWTPPLYTDRLGASPGEWHLSWIIRETAVGSSEGRAFQAEGRARERSLG